MPETDRIVLVGMRAVGKTTVGGELATRLGRPFQDSDELLAARAGEPAGALLRRVGEPRFRELEQDVVVDRLRARGPDVFALGGGAVLSPTTRAALLDARAFVVHLDAEPAVQARRQRQDPADRPALTSMARDEEIRVLAAQRAPYYAAVRDLRLDTGADDPAGCVRRVLSLLEAWG